jgi:molecular chaperone GrpE
MSDPRQDRPADEVGDDVARGATGTDAPGPEAPVGAVPVDDEPTDGPADDELRDSSVAGRDVMDAMGVDAEAGKGADAREGSEGGTPAEDDARSREELTAALAEVERERDEYLDALRRAQAEFANYRKRAMREGAEQRQQGIVEVLGRLADVVDDFELAVLAAESAQDVQSLRKGVEMVYGKLVDVLRSLGLERIGEEGIPFDPEKHDAVQKESGEEPIEDDPVVVEVLRPGYAVGDRVIRAAMVKVRT